MLSHWLGWFSLAFCIALMLKFVARKSKIKKINKMFRTIHVPVGVMLIFTGTFHGIISIIKAINRMLPIVSGIALLIVIAFIGATYVYRKALKKNWLKFHRIATLALIPILIVHVVASLL